MKINKSKMGWFYKGTGTRVLHGDRVLISKKLAEVNKVDREAMVSGLYGYITVQLSDSCLMDVDARSLTFIRRGEVI